MNISEGHQVKIPFTTTAQKFIKRFSYTFKSVGGLYFYYGREFCFQLVDTCFICWYIFLHFNITHHLQPYPTPAKSLYNRKICDRNKKIILNGRLRRHVL